MGISTDKASPTLCGTQLAAPTNAVSVKASDEEKADAKNVETLSWGFNQSPPKGRASLNYMVIMWLMYMVNIWLIYGYYMVIIWLLYGYKNPLIQDPEMNSSGR